MAFELKNHPYPVTSCGRRRTFMQGGEMSDDRTKESPFDKKRKKSNEPRKTTKGKGRNFRTVKEGNIFRRWVNKNHTSFANKLGLDEKGVCNNCYIYQAWYELKDDFLSSKEGRVFTNRIDSLILSPENHL